MSEQYKTYEGNEPYIFVSYAHKDTDIVMPIIRALQEAGFRVWYDAGIEAGTEWPEYISTHLKACACMLCCMSPNAAGSLNCRNEITLALNKNIPTLCVYLEDFDLPDGLDLQLCNFHALYRTRHKNDEFFLQELMKAKLLQVCLIITDNSTQISVKEDLSGQKTNIASSEIHDLYRKYLPEETPPDIITGSSPETSFQKLQELAANGNPRYQLGLGTFYELGCGVKKDIDKAVFWYTKAAEQDYVEAQYTLGLHYHSENDLQNALFWFLKAAEHNHIKAQCSLGNIYLISKDIDENLEIAVFWYRKAAEQDYAEAQYSLGICYYAGKGIEKDPEKAIFWWQKAAEQGHAKAQYLLGDEYFMGINIDKNPQKAVSLYQQAADQGDCRAMLHLAYCYQKGIGVQKSFTLARKWKKLARESDT